MPSSRRRQIVDFAPEKEYDRKPKNPEVVALFLKLEQNFPEVYRHLLGIAKAFLKER